ncbi:MAG: FkbM family methyltransferase [Rhabdochlamydiaceae bacterium]
MDHKNRFSRLISFIKDYRLQIHPSNRLSGVYDTLIGWGFIALNTVFFSPPNDFFLVEINFLVFFFSGMIILFLPILLQLFKNKKGLKSLKTFMMLSSYHQEDRLADLTFSQRIKWIYWRGFIATGGYIAYTISKIYFGVIDNSEIFGADALVYALMCYIVLNESFSLKELTGIFIATLGVFFVIFFDIESFNWIQGVIGGIAGILSAICMSVVFVMTGIIIRHDNPHKVAFHQCAAGFIISFAILLISSFCHLFQDCPLFYQIPPLLLKNAMISGALYGVSLIFFLRAFLKTEPIIITVLGYSLGVFVILLEWLFKGELIHVKDGISAGLIGVGCFLLIHQEYVKDKRRKIRKKERNPLYGLSFKHLFRSLKEKYKDGEINRYEYLSEKHEFNKLLMEYSKELTHLPIREIKINQQGVVFHFEDPLSIVMETDGGARSAPFEILNFGEYEKEDEEISYRLLKNGDTILDIGAHIGWFSINWAKRFPLSQIYAFEPVPAIFTYLKRNVNHNELPNVILNNYGCSDKNKEDWMYYFQGGSALSSVANLIDHPSPHKIKCEFRSIDEIVSLYKLKSVDLIKCDVEGSEWFVLKGAYKTLIQHKPIIFIELYEEWCKKCGYSTKDVISFMRELGYGLFQVYQRALISVMPAELDNKEHYNYFFLHLEHHKNFLSKESNFSGD